MRVSGRPGAGQVVLGRRGRDRRQRAPGRAQTTSTASSEAAAGTQASVHSPGSLDLSVHNLSAKCQTTSVQWGRPCARGGRRGVTNVTADFGLEPLTLETGGA